MKATNETSAQHLIESLQLTAHPEGGYFRETYRSSGVIDASGLSKDYNGPRNQCTCIYFLLTSEAYSAFHRVRQDEIWHFYQGSPIRLHQISPEGVYEEILIGNDLEQGQVPQYVVPGGYWFAAEVTQEDGYSLVGCTVAPGFDFQDFELAERSTLIQRFAQHSERITQFTRG